VKERSIKIAEKFEGEKKGLWRRRVRPSPGPFSEREPRLMTSCYLLRKHSAIFPLLAPMFEKL
jgi:hypothetical protein